MLFRPSLPLLTQCCLGSRLGNEGKLRTTARSNFQPRWRQESCMVDEKAKQEVISSRKRLFLSDMWNLVILLPFRCLEIGGTNISVIPEGVDPREVRVCTVD